MSDSVLSHGRQPTRLPRPWDSPGKNTGVGCHFLLQCMKVESESEVAQSCRLLATPWTAAYQAPPSMGFSGQQYWSGVPLPSPCVCVLGIKITPVSLPKWNPLYLLLPLLTFHLPQILPIPTEASQIPTDTNNTRSFTGQGLVPFCALALSYCLE